MLGELMEFTETTKIPPIVKEKRPSLKPDPSNKIKNSMLEVSKEEILEDPINISINRELTLGEKILLRKKKEEEEKRRKAEKIKELKKNKKMNLHQFLSRVQKYEQKRKYNLELKKYKQLQKERENLQEKPKLSYNTLKICQTMPKEPLYKRTNQILDEHEREIQNLTIFYTMPKEVREGTTGENSNLNKSNRNNRATRVKTKNSSVEVTRNSNFDTYKTSLETIENINNKNNNKKKITKQQSDDFFNREIKWLKNKKMKNQYFENFYKIQNDTYSDVTFKPYVSQATLEILDIKNNINANNDEIYKYHIPNSFSQYNNFILNKGRTIWDKLYEEASQTKNCNERYLYNNNNKNIRKKDRFRNVSSKYFDIYINKDKDNEKDKDKIKNKKNIKKNNSFNFKPNNLQKSRNKNKSFDDKSFNNDLKGLYSINNINKKEKKKKEFKRRSYFECNDINEYNYYKMKNEKEKFHWRNSLLKIKPLYKINDATYHLNIMQSGAWNDNYVNKVTIDDNTKCKSVLDLINID